LGPNPQDSAKGDKARASRLETKKLELRGKKEVGKTVNRLGRRKTRKNREKQPGEILETVEGSPTKKKGSL